MLVFTWYVHVGLLHSCIHMGIPEASHLLRAQPWLVISVERGRIYWGPPTLQVTRCNYAPMFLFLRGAAVLKLLYTRTRAVLNHRPNTQRHDAARSRAVQTLDSARMEFPTCTSNGRVTHDIKLKHLKF